MSEKMYSTLALMFMLLLFGGAGSYFEIVGVGNVATTVAQIIGYCGAGICYSQYRQEE